MLRSMSSLLGLNAAQPAGPISEQTHASKSSTSPDTAHSTRAEQAIVKQKIKDQKKAKKRRYKQNKARRKEETAVVEVEIDTVSHDEEKAECLGIATASSRSPPDADFLHSNGPEGIRFGVSTDEGANQKELVERASRHPATEVKHTKADSSDGDGKGFASAPSHISDKDEDSGWEIDLIEGASKEPQLDSTADEGHHKLVEATGVSPLEHLDVSDHIESDVEKPSEDGGEDRPEVPGSQKVETERSAESVAYHVETQTVRISICETNIEAISTKIKNLQNTVEDLRLGFAEIRRQASFETMRDRGPLMMSTSPQHRYLFSQARRASWEARVELAGARGRDSLGQRNLYSDPFSQRPYQGRARDPVPNQFFIDAQGDKARDAQDNPHRDQHLQADASHESPYDGLIAVPDTVAKRTSVTNEHPATEADDCVEAMLAALPADVDPTSLLWCD